MHWLPTVILFFLIIAEFLQIRLLHFRIVRFENMSPQCKIVFPALFHYRQVIVFPLKLLLPYLPGLMTHMPGQ